MVPIQIIKSGNNILLKRINVNLIIIKIIYIIFDEMIFFIIIWVSHVTASVEITTVKVSDRLRYQR